MIAGQARRKESSLFKTVIMEDTIGKISLDRPLRLNDKIKKVQNKKTRQLIYKISSSRAEIVLFWVESSQLLDF